MKAAPRKAPRTYAVPDEEECLRFLESAGGAAIVTVILGTIGGTVLNHVIQTNVREREMQQVTYERYLEQIEVTYGLVGSTIVATQGIIELAGPNLDRNKFQGEASKRIEEQRTDTRQAYNLAISRWRGRQQVVSLQMHYYRPHGDAMAETWERVASAVEKLAVCAEDWSTKDGMGVDISGACQSQKNAVASRMTELTEALYELRVSVVDGSR